MIEGRVIFKLPFLILVNQKVSPEMISDIIEIVKAMFSVVNCLHIGFCFKRPYAPNIRINPLCTETIVALPTITSHPVHPSF